jgi:hypothetical protein
MSHRKLHVAMGDILDALTRMRDDPYEYFLDLQTGLVVTVQEDEFEEDDAAGAIVTHPERYADIPRLRSDEEYDLMCRFSDSVDDEDIGEKLDLALRGPGAFRRFREVIFGYPDLRTRWLTMRQAALVAEAARWLDSIGIDPRYELLPIEPPAPLQAPSGVPPGAGLFDMLLLGAPEGKTELLDGRVVRQLSARTPSNARGTFKRLAKDLCRFY